MSLSNDILGGIVAIAVIGGVYLAYMAVILAFLWAVWNWIILPTLPYVAAAFA